MTLNREEVVDDRYKSRLAYHKARIKRHGVRSLEPHEVAEYYETEVIPYYEVAANRSDALVAALLDDIQLRNRPWWKRLFSI